MNTLAIDSLVFDVYADVAEADGYMIAAFGNAVWLAASELEKAQALVSATRVFNKQCWLGTANPFSGSTLVWPRTGTGITGVDDSVIPSDIAYGAIELANAILNGSDVQSNPVPGAQGLQIIKAGSVMLQYFRDANSLAERLSRFPIIVQEYVGRYLCGQSDAVTGVATGTTDESCPRTLSVTNDEYGYGTGI